MSRERERDALVFILVVALFLCLGLAVWDHGNWWQWLLTGVLLVFAAAMVATWEKVRSGGDDSDS